jgi:iron-sulfur cluster assembly protein
MATVDLLKPDADTQIEMVEAPAMTLTPTAEIKLRDLLQSRNIPNHGLRVFVAGGGCSGLQYGMAFEAQAREFDTVVDQNGVKLFIDPTSLMYLSGASIDFIDSLMGGGFKIENPNAVAACGCGSSFKTKDSASTGADEDAGCGPSCGCH